MIDTLSCGMVYAGSALMAFNVFSYVRFARGISRQGDWQREKRILRLRFFEGRTQMEVAGEIGISQAQVSRIEKAALEKIKKQM